MPVPPNLLTKQDVATTILNTLKGWEKSGLYEVTQVSPLLIRIRYKATLDVAPRYFDVKISEPY